jgi:hypothetical protein
LGTSLGIKEDEALVLILLGGNGELLALPCLLHNLTALPLLVLDLPLCHGQLLLHLGFGLGLGLIADDGVVVVVG